MAIPRGFVWMYTRNPAFRSKAPSKKEAEHKLSIFQ